MAKIGSHFVENVLKLLNICLMYVNNLSIFQNVSVICSKTNQIMFQICLLSFQKSDKSVQNVFKIGLQYVQSLFKIWPQSVREVSKLCWTSVECRFKICRKYVQIRFKICSKTAQNMSIICVKYVQIYPKYV